MGVIGQKIGEYAGGFLGGAVGKYAGGSKGEDIGKKIGSNAGGVVGGELIPFKTGGRIPGRKGKPIKILAHSGEFILPVGIAPTKMQKKAVAQKKMKARKSKK
jgi:outer membrane lipoprotein SlyB